MRLALSGQIIGSARSSSEVTALKLDPIYLLAPDPEEPTVRRFSRRALFLGVLGAFAVGSVAGRMASKWVGGSPPKPRGDIDASLAWALRVQDGSMQELIANADGFLARVVAYSDSKLQRGLTRLIDSAVDGDLIHGSERVDLARKLMSVIRASAVSEQLRARLPELEQIR